MCRLREGAAGGPEILTCGRPKVHGVQAIEYENKCHTKCPHKLEPFQDSILSLGNHLELQSIEIL